MLERSETVLINPQAIESLRESISPERSTEVLQEFLSLLEEQLGLLKQSFQDRQNTEFQRLCHNITSSAGMVGAVRLQNMAYDIEITCENGDYEGAFNMADTLMSCIDESLVAIKKYVGS